MKKFFVLICLFFALMSVQNVNAQMTSDDPVYIETISNPSKTINLILGLYPKTYKWSESLEASQITLRILNEATGDYDWSNYKVYILLKDNTLFYNYTTKAEGGEFDCSYTNDGNSGYHDQVVCFDKKFDVDDIKTVWVSFDTGIFFELLYYKK